MRIPRIFTSQTLNDHAEIALEEGPSRHLLKVLRLSEGAALILFNGEGKEYPAHIITAGKKIATLSLAQGQSVNRESPLHTHLYIALSRGERFELVLQKATELGVTEITPLFTERCEVKLKGERLQKKQQQWRQIIISACEQCQRNCLPTLHPTLNLSEALNKSSETLKLVLHHRAAKNIKELNEQVSSIALLIGPEGGLAEQEITQAQHCGFISSLIGPRVLRTETAPLVALSLLQAKWGDF